jgi:hypothetical protein
MTRSSPTSDAPQGLIESVCTWRHWGECLAVLVAVSATFGMFVMLLMKLRGL